MEIGKEFWAEAAHVVPNHQGKCRNLHGHSYKITIIARGEVVPAQSDRPDAGMLIDFADISSFWKEHLEPKLDHQFLNESLPISPPTAEMIAAWICATIIAKAPFQLKHQLGWVQVNETHTSYAKVSCLDNIVEYVLEQVYGSRTRS